MVQMLAITGLIFAAAILFASVGQAGASGYLAVLAASGLTPEVMKPTALALNVIVATITTVRFSRVGMVGWDKLWPFLIGSVPLAVVGGAVLVPAALYRVSVGLILVLVAGRLLLSIPVADMPHVIPRLPAIGAGAGIGFLAGLTGTGGGIFLSPLLLMRGWATTRQSVGLAATFILVNSSASILGNLGSLHQLPPAFPIWALVAAVGGMIGADLATRRLPTVMLRRLMAVVLVLVACKLILT